MTIRTKATLEPDGRLRLRDPVDLDAGAEFDVVLNVNGPTPNKTPGELLAEVASIPHDVVDIDPHVARDHDRHLYGTAHGAFIKGPDDPVAVVRLIREIAKRSEGHAVPPDVSTNADKYIYGGDAK